MKNKKMVFGIVIFLFAITGICNIQNTSAFTDTIYIPPLSYMAYNMGYLENGDAILINEIDSNGVINVYIMRESAFIEYQDSGTIYYLKKWGDIYYLSGWSYDITGSDNYYVVLVNNAWFTGKTVYVDISVRYKHLTPTQDWTFIIWMLAITIPAIISIVIIVIVLKKHRRKKLKEFIEQEVKKQEFPKITYCHECGAEIDKERAFCSKCGTKIIN